MFRRHCFWDIAQPLFSPLDLAGLGLSTGDDKGDADLTASGIEEALNDDSTDELAADDKVTSEINLDEDTSEDTDNEAEESDDEEKDSNDDKDEEDPEIDLDNEDELELSKIPKRKEILAKYPKIFKDFPALDHIIHREHAFAEVFPTVNDAKSAKEAVVSFNRFQSDLLNGDIKGVLSAVKQTDGKAFNKIVENFLTTLGDVDPSAHTPITQRVTKSILSYIHNAASESLRKNPSNERAEQMKLASEIIHEALYDTSDVTPYAGSIAAKGKEEENPEVEAFKKEKASFESSRYQAAFSSVATKMNNLLTNAVTRDIDTKNILPPYVKKTVVKDVMGELDRQLSGDTRFKGIVDKLWMKAKEEGFSSNSMDKIEKALKEKAKTILPAIMRAKKGEAMKGLSSGKREENRVKLQPKEDKGERRASRDKVTSTRRDSSRLPAENESNLDFLMRD